MTEEYTGPKRCDLCLFEKDLPCIGKDCNSVNDLQGFRPKGAKTETRPVDLSSVLSMGEWEVFWMDVDHIQITGPHGQCCVMAGGDFESLLSALSAAFSQGQS